MKLFLLVFSFLACTQTKLQPNHLEFFSDSEIKNINLYLDTMNEETPLNFGAIKLAKGLTVKVSDIFIYSYKDLRAKDEKKKLRKPNWLSSAENSGLSMQEILSLTEKHLTNLDIVMNNSNIIDKKMNLQCCTANQKKKLKVIYKKIVKASSAMKEVNYKDSREYFLANLYWVFVEKD